MVSAAEIGHGLRLSVTLLHEAQHAYDHTDRDNNLLTMDRFEAEWRAFGRTDEFMATIYPGGYSTSVEDLCTRYGFNYEQVMRKHGPDFEKLREDIYE
jgi:hypothetical protein